MANLIVASCVEGELRGIWKFIARDNPEAAMRFIRAVKATFRRVAENPALGRKRRFQNSRLQDIRSWQVSGFENYLIFYRNLPAGIEVLHVYHAARDVESLFADE